MNLHPYPRPFSYEHRCSACGRHMIEGDGAGIPAACVNVMCKEHDLAGSLKSDAKAKLIWGRDAR